MAIAPARIFLDANVLFAAQLRSLLLTLAEQRHIEVLWSAKVQEEWAEALGSYRPELIPSIARTQSAMADAFPEACVTGYETGIAAFELPDRNDRHVAAAAAHARCRIILTLNLRDFPNDALAAHNIVAVHPDTFFAGLMMQSPKELMQAIKTARELLKNPAMSPEAYLAGFERLGLLTTAALLQPYAEAI